jgi:hypothetical protein
MQRLALLAFATHCAISRPYGGFNHPHPSPSQLCSKDVSRLIYSLHFVLLASAHKSITNLNSRSSASNMGCGVVQIMRPSQAAHGPCVAAGSPADRAPHSSPWPSLSLYPPFHPLAGLPPKCIGNRLRCPVWSDRHISVSGAPDSLMARVGRKAQPCKSTILYHTPTSLSSPATSQPSTTCRVASAEVGTQAAVPATPKIKNVEMGEGGGGDTSPSAHPPPPWTTRLAPARRTL